MFVIENIIIIEENMLSNFTVNFSVVVQIYFVNLIKMVISVVWHDKIPNDIIYRFFLY